MIGGLQAGRLRAAQQVQEHKQITQLIENEITRSGSIIAQFRH